MQYVLHFQTACLAAEVGSEFFRLAADKAFGGEQAFKAEAEQIQLRGVDVQIELVARFAEAAVADNAVASQCQIDVGAAQVLVLVAHIGLACQRRTGQDAVLPLHLATDVGAVGQGAFDVDVAVDAAAGKAVVQFVGVEVLAVYFQLQRTLLKQGKAA